VPFLALTGAPFLEAGVKLNVMATPQVEGVAPASLRVGERLTIRFGHCCPDMVEGEITALAFDHAVLTVGATDWILDPGPCGSGIRFPGIVSEDWIVRAPGRSTRA
jgi:hypothetical protein